MEPDVVTLHCHQPGWSRETGNIENRVSDIFCDVLCLQTRNQWKCWLHQMFIIRHTERGKVLSMKILKVKIKVPANEIV